MTAHDPTSPTRHQRIFCDSTGACARGRTKERGSESGGLPIALGPLEPPHPVHPPGAKPRGRTPDGDAESARRNVLDAKFRPKPASGLGQTGRFATHESLFRCQMNTIELLRRSCRPHRVLTWTKGRRLTQSLGSAYELRHFHLHVELTDQVRVPRPATIVMSMRRETETEK